MVSRASARAPGSPVSLAAPRSAANSLVRESAATKARLAAAKATETTIHHNETTGSTVSVNTASTAVMNPSTMVASW